MFSVLTHFTALVAQKDEQGHFAALDHVVDACLMLNLSSSWLALLLSVAESILYRIPLDALLDVML
jgi:hypothetical protein